MPARQVYGLNPATGRVEHHYRVEEPWQIRIRPHAPETTRRMNAVHNMNPPVRRSGGN